MTPRGESGSPTHVLDSSAILAMLLGEDGADMVREAGPDGLVSAVIYSELIAKLLDRGSTMSLVLERLEPLALKVVPFDAQRARNAALLRGLTRGHNISFADLACLSLGVETGLPVITGDREWAQLELATEVRLIR